MTLHYYRAMSRAFTLVLGMLAGGFVVADLVLGEEIVGTTLAACFLAAMLVRQICMSIAGVEDQAPERRFLRTTRHPWVWILLSSAAVAGAVFAQQTRDGRAALRSLILALIAGLAFGTTLWWSELRERSVRAR